APDDLIVYARRHKGRHRVHVRRQRNDRLAKRSKHIPAVWLDFFLLNNAVVSGADVREAVVKILADFSFFRRYGRDIDQGSRQIKYVHFLSLTAQIRLKTVPMSVRRVRKSEDFTIPIALHLTFIR